MGIEIIKRDESLCEMLCPSSDKEEHSRCRDYQFCNFQIFDGVLMKYDSDVKTMDDILEEIIRTTTAIMGRVYRTRGRA